MPDNHILTKQIGNLRGFSTDSIFLRPSNVADLALNVMTQAGKTMGPRRGYQCQVATTGGFGTATYENLRTNEVETITLNQDGNLYKKLQRHIYLFYNGLIGGVITNIGTGLNPTVTTAAPHSLISGTEVLINGVDGITDVNGKIFSITVTGANTFTIPTTTTGVYISGGTYNIAFMTNRYLTFSIYTDPDYITTGGSITCKIVVNFALQVNGAQSNVNSITVDYLNQLTVGQVVQFIDTAGVQQTRTITGTSTTGIIISGTPVSVADGTVINQLVLIPFGKGFDVVAPGGVVTLADFVAAISQVVGLSATWDGEHVNTVPYAPAAFLALLEPTVFPNNTTLTLDYYYWILCNKPVIVSLPGTANPIYQDSADYENASFTSFDDVLYVSNGIDYPQKYDGQTVYRTGMPKPPAPLSIVDDSATMRPKPFSTGETYKYAITYEQVDNIGHIIEGVASNIVTHTVVDANCALDVNVYNIIANSDGWNTNCAIKSGGAAAAVYGPDSNGFWYDKVLVSSSTLNIGDTAFYTDTTCAVVNGAQVDQVVIPVLAGHNVEAGDDLIFVSTDGGGTLVSYQALAVTATALTLEARQDNVIDPVSVADLTDIYVNKTSLVFGDLAIVDGTQTVSGFLPVITVKVGHSLQMNDVVEFLDSIGQVVRAQVVSTGATTITIVSTTSNAFTVIDKTLVPATTFTVGEINLQRTNFGPATIAAGSSISNNLRINIYRTKNGGTEFLLFGTVPNNSTAGTQLFIDSLGDKFYGFQLGDNNVPNVQDSPPISKYILAFGNQMIYAGGQRDNAESEDYVYYSLGTQPENVPPATNFEYFPSTDDEITGVGSAGTTLVVCKNRGIWAFSGILERGKYSVNPIAPGSNIGCVSFASMRSIGSLLYFLHSNGVYAITENQFFPTDAFGNPVPLSLPIDVIFRRENYLAQNQYQLKRAIAWNYTKDNQYLLFLPCQDPNATQNVANQNSIMLCYDTLGKNWYEWSNINAAGGIFSVGDDLYFHERRNSGVTGNTANLYKQHRYYRLIDYADHTQPIDVQWRSSWEDLGQPEVRKKFSHCVLLIDRVSSLDQRNRPFMTFSSYLDRIPNLQNTIAPITTVNNTMNAFWSLSAWSWGVWGGYQDSFIRINLKSGTVAKSIQVGFSMFELNASFRLAGFQLEAIPEFRKTFVR